MSLEALKALEAITREATLRQVERVLSDKLVEPGLRKSQWGGLSLAIGIVQEMNHRTNPFTEEEG
jgi:hypothetical protein